MKSTTATENLYTGEKATLRIALPEDRERLWQSAQDPEVIRGLRPWAGAAAWAMDAPGSFFANGLCLAAAPIGEDSRLIGAAYLEGRELAYFVERPLWGKGLGADLVRGACHVAITFLGLPGLQASVQRENLASRKVLERNGFRFAGLRKASHRLGPGRLAVLQYIWRQDSPT